MVKILQLALWQDHNRIFEVCLQGEEEAAELQKLTHQNTMWMRIMEEKVHLQMMNAALKSGIGNVRGEQGPDFPCLLHLLQLWNLDTLEMIQKEIKKAGEFLLVLCGAQRSLLGVGVVLGVIQGMAAIVVAIVGVLIALVYPDWLIIIRITMRITKRYKRFTFLAVLLRELTYYQAFN